MTPKQNSPGPVDSAPVAPDGAKNKTRGAFAVVLIAGFMALLDVSIVNVALPSIEAHLHTTPSEIQWIVAGYSLTFGLIMIAAGKAGDIFGRRLLFLAGVSGFSLASLACGLAPTASFLVVSRLIQGTFAGILNPQILGLIQDLFTGKRRARAFGTYGAMVGVSTAIGPLLGGFLIQTLGPNIGWRSVFMINVPIAAVVIPLIIWWLPHRKTTKMAARSLIGKFDPVGVLLLGGIVVGIMWPFMEQSDSAKHGGSLLDSLWILIIPAALIAVFFLWERFWEHHGGSVLISPRLLKSPSYVIGVATGFSYLAGFTSIFVIPTMYLQEGAKFSPFAAGAAQVPFALLAGASAMIAGRLVVRWGRSVPLVGSTIMLLSCVAIGWFATVGEPRLVPVVTIVLLGIAGAGSGLIISPNQTLTLEVVPPSDAGVAAAVLQTMQRIGTSIGLAVVTMVFFTSGFSSGTGSSLAEDQAAFAKSMLLVAAIASVTVMLNLVDRFRTHEKVVRQEKVSKG